MSLIRLAWCTALAALLLPRPIEAQAGQSRRPAQADSVAADTAVLRVAGRQVAVFRVPFGARSPTDRAADAARRIDALVEADVTDSIGTRRIPEGMLAAPFPLSAAPDRRRAG